MALRHSEDPTLLSDLKATYRWLNKNVEDAREALVYAIDIPLFLNVVDPLTSEWIGNWQPASELVLNLTEDYGTLKVVRPFLHDYEEDRKSTLGPSNRLKLWSYYLGRWEKL